MIRQNEWIICLFIANVFVYMFVLPLSLSSLSLLAPPLAAQVPAGFALSPGDGLPGLATVDVGLEGDTGGVGVGEGAVVPASGLLPAAALLALACPLADPEGRAWGLWGAPRGGRGAARPP